VSIWWMLDTWHRSSCAVTCRLPSAMRRLTHHSATSEPQPEGDNARSVARRTPVLSPFAYAASNGEPHRRGKTSADRRATDRLYQVEATGRQPRPSAPATTRDFRPTTQAFVGVCVSRPSVTLRPSDNISACLTAGRDGIEPVCPTLPGGFGTPVLPRPEKPRISASREHCSPTEGDPRP
jgi:hypothetical protein